MLRTSALLTLPCHSVQPSQLCLGLLNHQAHHPHSLMVRMPHFFQDRAQDFLLSYHFLLKKLLPPTNLLLKHSRPRLPGERNPSQKRRPVSLRRPIFAFERIRQCCATFGRRLKAAALRPRSRLIRFQRTNQPGTRQFFQRIVNLWTRNPRPILDLSPHQFCVRLIPVHRPLRQQTQEHQIRRRQVCLGFLRHLVSFARSFSSP